MSRGRKLAPAIACLACAALLGGVAAAPGAEARAKGCRHAGALPSKSGVGTARRATVCLINRQRRSHGLNGLDTTGSLHDAADRHDGNMLSLGCFAHQCGDEAGLVDRILDTSYLPCGACSWGVAENIAWGTGDLGTPRAIVRGWMKSPGHRANILNPDYEDIGAAVVLGIPDHPDADGATYTTDFGYKG